MDTTPAVLQSLDFFSLTGLDSYIAHHDQESPAGPGGDPGTTDAAHTTQRSNNTSPDAPLDDPSPIALDLSRSSSSQGAYHHNPHHHPHHQQKPQHKLSRTSLNGSHNNIAAMDGGDQGSGGQQSGHNTPALGASHMRNMDLDGAAYDALQAGILQSQLESIHMQSPFMGATNPNSPYGAMAHMFLASPPGQSTSGSLPDSHSQLDRPTYQRKATNVIAGVLTPGPSGEMMPETRMDMMSPMQLEMLARGEGIEGMENFTAAPLLSPALSQSASAFASPVAHVAFNSANANQYALEQLQMQQRQFQEQLALLQEQQRQLQVTAAAVAAASGSPFLSAQQPQYQQHQHQHQHQQQHQQQQSRPAVTPGGVSAGANSAGSISTPSPGSYFSPLTSPALEPAVSRSAALRAAAAHAHLSPGLHNQHNQRQPHPLSALSSPALNPVGSSGGAQQTLSPALGPQSGHDLADSDYINALQGILDSSSNDPNAAYQVSPALGPSGAPPLTSPALGSTSTGPHRLLPPKTRPSPMMKPTHHRSHVRQSSNSVPTSPMTFKLSQGAGGGVGYVPPMAIDQRGVQQHQQQQAQQAAAAACSSTSSTPSPVDLAHIMPPPPVPTSNTRPKSVMPMTPATLMNLGANQQKLEPTLEHQETAAQRRQAEVPPPRAAAKKATAAIAPAQAGGAVTPKRGSRLVPSGGAAATKRALAIRPPGGVGVRAATKGAAAAAAAAASTEPETRRTSHKAAEQKRRDSLKAGFDELRLLLPAINTEALDPESGEPIPGSSAPRLLPKSSLVPDDNPNRGVSKVALLKFSNEYIVRLHSKVEKRDDYIDKLRDEISRLRGLGDPSVADTEIRGDEDEDLLDMDMLDGEEDDLASDEEEEDDMDVDEEVVGFPTATSASASSSSGRKAGGSTSKVGKSPALGPTKRPAPRSTKTR